MRAVGIRELKNRLSEYLRLVEEGEVVLVTHRDQVVAALGPPPQFQRVVDETATHALERLSRAGMLRLAVGEPLSISAALLTPPSTPIDLQAVLDAAREDRLPR